jgi:hypothetical protein
MNKILWLGTPESRIISIRKFRQYISTLSINEAVELTKKEWKASPSIKKEQFNIENIEEWPNPWNLFGLPYHCNNSQTIGMLYSLIMSEHGKNHTINLAIFYDVVIGQYSKILIDDTHEKVITMDQIKKQMEKK